MTSLQGLPPLPKTLRGLLKAGRAQWKETERIHQLRTSIEQDIEDSECADDATEFELVEDSGMLTVTSPGLAGSRRNSVNKPLPPSANLEAAIAYLRKEMVGLRQMDMSLLCKLWGLNEAIQELKSHPTVASDTMSDCSSLYENGVDGISTIEEHEYENELFHSQVYENIPSRGHTASPATTRGVIGGGRTTEDDIYEPVYLEPTPCKSQRGRHAQNINNNVYSKNAGSVWKRPCACGATVYESNC